MSRLPDPCMAASEGPGVAARYRTLRPKLAMPNPQRRAIAVRLNCSKLAASRLGRQRSVMIYAFDLPAWPAAPAVEAFELLADRMVYYGLRQSASFADLIHPVRRVGSVFA